MAGCIYLYMLKAILSRFIDEAVKKYLSGMPDKDIARVIGALGLTEEIYKRVVEAAAGERHVYIYFADGAHVEITNQAKDEKVAVGW